MRVLVNMLTSVPNRLSGISVYAWSQLRALIEHGGADYALMTNWSRERVAEQIPLDAITFIPGTTPRSEKLFMVGAYRVWRAARRLNADIVFTPHPFGSLAGGRARVCVVHDLYRDTHSHLFRADRRWTWDLVFPLALSTQTRIVCVSNATQSDLLHYHPSVAGRTAVVHEASSVRAPASSQSLVDGRYALFVANVAPTKNVETFLAALDQLENDETVPPVLWVGRDDDTGLVARALARRPSLSKFKPVGQKSEADLATLYRHAEFLVVPSLMEGFCLPVLEAQGFGVPVVCSDIPVLREVAGKGARFFDPRDPTDMASAIRDVAHNPKLRADLSAAASENAGQFSWARAARELYGVFEQALEGSAGAAHRAGATAKPATN
jgi:glycosyltransferase involved in cell wall biosynthesis